MSGKRFPVLTSARRRILDRLLDQYLELDPVDRPAFVDRIRHDWPRLARWFVPLSSESRTTSSLLSRWPTPIANELLDERLDPDIPELEPGTRLGPWRVQAFVGAGGMGKVYRGERADGAFEKEVAIKLIGSRGRELAGQLRHESRLLARLDHPTVTRLIDAGVTESDEPYLVMEWIEGSDLEDWLAASVVEHGDRLELFIELARAVAHAHQRLIVHGDIKPGNIRINDKGRIKLMDFGVAHLVSEEATRTAKLRALTPAFAAPEQLEDGNLTTRSDVWSLGALLFWMLTGRIFDRKQSTADQIRLPTGISRHKEVAAILRKACAEDPEQRYSSVEALLDDLQRYRSSQPVGAMPPTRGYLLGRFIARNRLAVAVTGVIGLLLVAGVGGVAWQSEKARQEAERAQAEAERARIATERSVAVRDFLADIIAESSPHVSPGDPPTVRDMLDRARDSIGDEMAEQPEVAAELLGVIGNSYLGLNEFDPARETLSTAIELIDAETVPRLDRATVAKIRYHYAFAAQDPEISPHQARLGMQDIEDVEGQEGLRADLKGILAYQHLMSGDPDAAESKGRASAELACAEQKPVTETCVTRLADLYYFIMNTGDHESAYEAARQAYSSAQEVFDSEPHPILIGAGIAYSEALNHAGRPSAAIDLLEDVKSFSRDALQEGSAIESATDFRLAQSYVNAGRDRTGVQVQKQALSSMASLNPGNDAIPVQLNFLTRSLLDLLRLEEIEVAYADFDDAMPESIRTTSIDLRTLIELRRDWHLGKDRTRLITDLENLLEDFRSRETQEPAIVQSTLLTRWAWAIDSNDLVQAHLWKPVVEAAPGTGSPNPLYHQTQARYHLLAGQPDPAMQHALTALEQHDETEEHDGPRLARGRAILAGSLCQAGDTETAREWLDQSLEFWQEAEQPRRGMDRMNELAKGCSGLLP